MWHLVNMLARIPTHSLQLHSRCKAALKVVQILRIDVPCLGDESLHLDSNISFNLQLLDILHLACQWVLFEEVSHEDVLDITLLL